MSIDTIPADAKPVADLVQLGLMLKRRDEIIHAAHEFGLPRAQISQITGIARTTINRILAKPGQS